MALGAIAALKEAGKLLQVKVGGFDGSPDAVSAIKAGELQYTTLQPVVVCAKEAVDGADSLLKTGKTVAATPPRSNPDGAPGSDRPRRLAVKGSLRQRTALLTYTTLYTTNRRGQRARRQPSR